MISKQKMALIATASILSGIVVFGFVVKSRTVKAFNPQPDPPGFGMVGIAANQTLRINVVNTSVSGTVESPPDPCRVTLNFLDQNGDLVRRQNGTILGRVELLNAGQSASIDLNADNFLRYADSTGRLELRPVARVQQADPIGDVSSPPDPCIPSIEVFGNSSGRTQLYVSYIPAVQRPVSASTGN